MTTVPVSLISTIGRIRQPDPKRVERLIASIADVGLLNPITVYPKEVVRNGQAQAGLGLIAGMHRLEAAKRLGWTEIEAVVVDLGEHQRVIAECDENLCGTNLSPAEVALFTARRKAAYEALHPETKNGAIGNGREKVRKVCEATDRFTADTAAKTGASERKVQLDAERGTRITEDVLAIVKGTRLDTGVYLDALKKVPEAEQLARVREDLRAKPVPRAPTPHDDEDVTERQVAALMSAWNRAGLSARNEFLSRIGRRT